MAGLVPTIVLIVGSSFSRSRRGSPADTDPVARPRREPTPPTRSVHIGTLATPNACAAMVS
jgi:hypothetical protein